MTGGLAQATDRGGRRKARRAAIDNIYKQARKVVQKNQRKGLSPPTAGELLKKLDTRVFRVMSEEIGLNQAMVLETLYKAGAIEKGGRAMVEKTAKAKTRKVWGLWKPVAWHDDYYKMVTHRLITWLGVTLVCVLVVLAAMVAFDQVQMAVRFGNIGSFIAGFLAGGVGVALLANKRKGQ